MTSLMSAELKFNVRPRPLPEVDGLFWDVRQKIGAKGYMLIDIMYHELVSDLVGHG